MTTPTVDQVLPRVRRWVIEHRASAKGQYGAFGLSYITMQVSDRYAPWMQAVDGRGVVKMSQFTSHSPKNMRGLVQQCLGILAREGIMYTRQKQEFVEVFDRGHRDKWFRIRITQADAQRRLKKMKA